jgi:hypothetical protein
MQASSELALSLAGSVLRDHGTNQFYAFTGLEKGPELVSLGKDNAVSPGVSAESTIKERGIPLRTHHRPTSQPTQTSKNTTKLYPPKSSSQPQTTSRHGLHLLPSCSSSSYKLACCFRSSCSTIAQFRKRQKHV